MKKDNSAFQERRRWIRALYLQDSTIAQLRRSFQEQPHLQHLQLRDFLAQHEAATIIYHLKKAASTRTSIPDRHAFQHITLTKELQPFLTFLASAYFKEYLQQITCLPLAGLSEIHLLRFGTEDYTLLHDNDIRRNAIVITFEFTALWDSTFGGYDSYIVGVEEPLLIYPLMNTATIVRTTKQTQQFTKYVNHRAEGHKRYFVRVTYLLEKQ